MRHREKKYMIQLMEFAANGLFLGAIYALLAVPMSVVWVTTDVIDVSTGGYAVVAGVIAVAFGFPFGPIIGIAAAAALGVVAGIIFVAFNALRVRMDPILVVLATFALMLAIESSVLTTVGTDSKFLDSIRGTLELGGAFLPYQGIFNLVMSVIIMGGLFAVLKWSPLGLRMRASAVSDKASVLVGIPVRRTQFLTFVVCAAISGIAGVLAVMSIGITFASTFILTTAAFSGAVLLGRAGPLPAFIGGLLLGVVTAFSDAYLPSGWSQAVPSALIILVLATGRMPATAFTGARP